MCASESETPGLIWGTWQREDKIKAPSYPGWWWWWWWETGQHQLWWKRFYSRMPESHRQYARGTGQADQFYEKLEWGSDPRNKVGKVSQGRQLREKKTDSVNGCFVPNSLLSVSRWINSGHSSAMLKQKEISLSQTGEYTVLLIQCDPEQCRVERNSGPETWP